MRTVTSEPRLAAVFSNRHHLPGNGAIKLHNYIHATPTLRRGGLTTGASRPKPPIPISNNFDSRSLPFPFISISPYPTNANISIAIVVIYNPIFSIIDIFK